LGRKRITGHKNYLINAVVIKPEVSTLFVPKPLIGHNPEPKAVTFQSQVF
jgi:hypothetical protein